jgi:anti-anti-sigma factor
VSPGVSRDGSLAEAGPDRAPLTAWVGNLDLITSSEFDLMRAIQRLLFGTSNRPTAIPHDAFISYCSHDKAVADAVCQAMEAANIRCWIAPRDVTPSADWGAAIVDAIAAARIMIVIFSAAANNSGQLQSEVSVAVDHDKPILPFRIEDVAPSGSLRLHFGRRHWLDAVTPPIEGHFDRLVQMINRLLSRSDQSVPIREHPEIQPQATSEPETSVLPQTQSIVPAQLPSAPDTELEPRGASFERSRPLVTLKPTGRLDNSSSGDFTCEILQSLNYHDVLLDFSNLEYISSAGLRAVMSALRGKPKRSRLAIAAPSLPVNDILEISHFGELLPIFSNVTEASAPWPVAGSSGKPITVRFWGTRASVLDALAKSTIREKIREALLAASGRTFDPPNTVDKFIDQDLPFYLRGTFGLRTSFVEIAIDNHECIFYGTGTGAEEFARAAAAEGKGEGRSLHIFIPRLERGPAEALSNLRILEGQNIISKYMAPKA